MNICTYIAKHIIVLEERFYYLYTNINFQLFRKSLKKHVVAVLHALGGDPAIGDAPALGDPLALGDVPAAAARPVLLQVRHNTQTPGNLCVKSVMLFSCQYIFIVAI